MRQKNLVCRIIIFCLFSFLIACNKREEMPSIYYYNQQQYYYPKPQSQYYYPLQNNDQTNNYPGSRYYSNPYKVPKRGYYYDQDYYYYPPTYYNSWAQDNEIAKEKKNAANVYNDKQ